MTHIQPPRHLGAVPGQSAGPIRGVVPVESEAAMSEEQRIDGIKAQIGILWTIPEDILSDGELQYRTDIELLLALARRQRERIAVLEAALHTIKDRYGHVCDNFEVCTHRACSSSYGSWAIADEVLRGDPTGVQASEDGGAR